MEHIKTIIERRKLLWYNSYMNEVCPICKNYYDEFRKKVKYHISYKPEKFIFACSECNNLEFLERRGFLGRLINNIKNLRQN